MKRLALLRRLEAAFPYRPREIFFTFLGNDIHSALGCTVERDDQHRAIAFKGKDDKPLAPADPLVAGYWQRQKTHPKGDTIEAFKARTAEPRGVSPGNNPKPATDTDPSENEAEETEHAKGDAEAEYGPNEEDEEAEAESDR